MARRITKALAGVEDLLINDTETKVDQERAGGTYPITGIRMIRPVNSVADLDLLDPTLFPKASVHNGSSVTFYEYDTLDAEYKVVNVGNSSVYDTTYSIILSVQAPSPGDIIRTLGYSARGDGGAAQWQFTGVTGLTPSQTPKDLLDSKLTDANGNEWQLIEKGRIKSKTLGVFPSSDAGEDLTFFIGLFGDLLIEAGTYTFPYVSDNTSGVIINDIRDSFDIKCENGVIFDTDVAGLDGSFIRLQVISNGSGVDEESLTWRWDGGLFDQREQKNSTSIPFAANFPPVKPGTAAVTDGIYITGDYNDGSTKTAVKYCEVKNVETVGSYDHWELAGGDSGIFIAGCKVINAHHNTHYGTRDLGIYTSTTGDAADVVKSCIIDSNSAFNCCLAFSMKRAAMNCRMTNNTAVNCFIGYDIAYVTGTEGKNVVISNNVSTQAWKPVRVQYSDGLIIANNAFSELGSTLADGSAATGTFADAVYIDMLGCNGSKITNNTCIGKNPLYVSGTFGTGVRLSRFDTGGGFINCERNTISGNTVTGINSCGEEVTVDVDNNKFTLNDTDGCNNKEFNLLGASSFNLAMGTTNGYFNVTDSSGERLLRVLSNGSVATDNNYRVGTTQVVTNQQPAIADSVGGDEQAKINLILGMLRTHGLIDS